MLAIAHRGASGYAPENTRAEFDLAIAIGSDMIETDVQVTRDGHLVLFHDDLVDRTSDGQGPLADHTLAELRSLDLGIWFGTSFAGERVMTLDECLEEVGSRIPLCLEIKDPLATGPLLDAIAMWTEKVDPATLHVTSFAWGALLLAASRSPALTLGYLSTTFDRDLIRRCAGRGIRQVCPPVRRLEPELVDAAHEAGLSVRAWSIREPADVDHLFASGADGATCNWPDWIIDRRETAAREQ